MTVIIGLIVVCFETVFTCDENSMDFRHWLAEGVGLFCGVEYVHAQAAELINNCHPEKCGFLSNEDIELPVASPHSLHPLPVDHQVQQIIDHNSSSFFHLKHQGVLL